MFNTVRYPTILWWYQFRDAYRFHTENDTAEFHDIPKAVRATAQRLWQQDNYLTPTDALFLTLTEVPAV